MIIERITGHDDVDIAALNHLLTQQSPGSEKAITADDLLEALSNPNFYLFVARSENNDARLVGIATMFFQRNLVRWMAEIHDVVVDQNCRGQGIGETLVTELLGVANGFAHKRNVRIKLYLTSRPSRTAANALYAKHGFTKVAEATGSWGTNLYKLMIEPS